MALVPAQEPWTKAGDHGLTSTGQQREKPKLRLGALTTIRLPDSNPTSACPLFCAAFSQSRATRMGWCDAFYRKHIRGGLKCATIYWWPATPYYLFICIEVIVTEGVNVLKWCLKMNHNTNMFSGTTTGFIVYRQIIIIFLHSKSEQLWNVVRTTNLLKCNYYEDKCQVTHLIKHEM